MTVSAKAAVSGIPVKDDQYVVGHGGTTALVVNPGDYVAYSGSCVVAAPTALSYWKVSGVGIALDRNPAYDAAGRAVVNSGILIATRGQFRVSASFSGQPNLGTVAAMKASGSGVNAASGVTGAGGTWITATPVSVSGGTAAGPVVGVAQVVGWHNSGPAGTGQLDIRLWPRNADYY